MITRLSTIQLLVYGAIATSPIGLMASAFSFGAPVAQLGRGLAGDTHGHASRVSWETVIHEDEFQNADHDEAEFDSHARTVTQKVALAIFLFSLVDDAAAVLVRTIFGFRHTAIVKNMLTP